MIIAHWGVGGDQPSPMLLKDLFIAIFSLEVMKSHHVDNQPNKLYNLQTINLLLSEIA